MGAGQSTPSTTPVASNASNREVASAPINRNLSHSVTEINNIISDIDIRMPYADLLQRTARLNSVLYEELALARLQVRSLRKELKKERSENRKYNNTPESTLSSTSAASTNSNETRNHSAEL